ncbi:MAG: cytochrome c1 [Alphaproteobacteria bacterium]|nr:cytochrome c1 [Alphaproteobacteria bacterium]
MRKTLIALIASAVALPALAASDAKAPMSISWSHLKPFGTFDRAELQRGYQVYKEVCAACHAAKYLAFRNLTEIGFSEAEVKAIAASYQIKDGPNDEGEMFDRPGKPSDRLPSPFANEKAARAANSGAYPPDLSIVVKARHNGANYVYSLLNGYEDAPPNIKLGDGMTYNPYFPGMQIAMPKILNDEQVTYADGTKATIAQMAKDVTAFLSWASEPETEARHALGMKVMIFMLIAIGLLYAAKRRVWAGVEH